MGKQCAGTIRLPAALSKQAVFWHGNTAASEWLETPIFFDLKKAPHTNYLPCRAAAGFGPIPQPPRRSTLSDAVPIGPSIRHKPPYTAFHHSSIKAAQKPRLSQLSQHLPEIIHPKTPPGHSKARGRLPMPRRRFGLADLWETVSQANTIGSRPARFAGSMRIAQDGTLIPPVHLPAVMGRDTGTWVEARSANLQLRSTARQHPAQRRTACRRDFPPGGHRVDVG